METSKVQFDLVATGPGLTLTVRYDGAVQWQGPVGTETIAVDWQFDDDEADHLIELELTGKLPEHTKIDDHGNIVNDVLLHVQNITFDNISIDNLFWDKCVYAHDFNGTQPAIEDKFFGTMGCNGIVSLRFTTPVYLWLLENM